MNDTPTTIDLLEDPATVEADHRAVQRFLETGIPVDPAVRDRVRARADRIREKTREKFGIVNIQELLPPSTYDDE
jgi:hypothetical protein